MLWVNALGRIGPGGVGASGAALCHIERDGLRYLVPVSEDVNPLFAFSFIQSFLDTLTEYLGDVTEGTVKDNFDIVYMVRLGADDAADASSWRRCLMRDTP